MKGSGGAVIHDLSGDRVLVQSPGRYVTVDTGTGQVVSTRAGKVIGPEERLTPLEGIRAFTINAAYASFEESIKGSIEPGKLADFAILDKDPCAAEPWAIRDIKVERTIIGGQTVFEI